MTPDRQPVLEGTLVRLRPMTAKDREALFAVASDPLVWEVHPARDRWQREVFDAFFDAGLASGGALVIEDRGSGAVIGSSRYDGHDPEADEIEIGWTYIARRFWGGTYNREIKRLMLDHIHRFVGIATFMVGEDNGRSRKSMLKFGGVMRPCAVEWKMAG